MLLGVTWIFATVWCACQHQHAVCNHLLHDGRGDADHRLDDLHHSHQCCRMGNCEGHRCFHRICE